DRRRVAGHSRVAFMNGATQYGQIEYFLVPPGSDISTSLSQIVLAAPGMTTRFVYAPGDYELYARQPHGNGPAGPVPVTLEGGGIYSLLTANGAVTGTVDVVFLEDFVEFE